MMKKYIKTDPNLYVDYTGKQKSVRKPKKDFIGKKKYPRTDTYIDYKGRQHNIGKKPVKKSKGGDVKAIKTVAAKLSKASKAHAGQSKVLKRIVSKYV